VHRVVFFRELFPILICLIATGSKFIYRRNSMKIKIIACIAAVLGIAAFCPVSAIEKNGQKIAVAATTGEDQTGLALTIYNVNLGLVKDQRQISLAPGTGNLRFMDVASQIMPTSVHIRSFVNTASLQVLEQNYEYDLLSPQKLLDKYVGKELKLATKNPYTEREEVVTATLLSNNGQPIFRIGDEITFGHPGRIIFPGVPQDLNARPTLVWMLRNDLPSMQKVEASYLTNGINWRSDYVVTLNERDDRADLAGWVTIDNHSGATYQNARIKLVAGDVNRVKDKQEYMDGMLRAAAMEAKAAPARQFREESFFEYHIYTLDRTATVKDNQTKQINLVSADNITVKKELVCYGSNYYYYSPYGEQTASQKVGVYVEIRNRQENNLGIPLPKGTVRVYKADHEGSLQFVGEDSIDHTAKDEKFRIKLGDAFDVVAGRSQTDWKKIAYDTYEAAFEISLRNHKKEDVTVKVVEPVPGDWSMVSSSHPHTKSEAFTAEFNVPVPKDKEVKLTYRVRMRY
jgi:hypothetical protein